jgi:hypothetical protein
MTRNHLTIAISPTGEITTLYCGPDREAARAALDKAPGAARTELYMYLSLTKFKNFPVQEPIQEKTESSKDKRK